MATSKKNTEETPGKKPAKAPAKKATPAKAAPAAKPASAKKTQAKATAKSAPKPVTKPKAQPAKAAAAKPMATPAKPKAEPKTEPKAPAKKAVPAKATPAAKKTQAKATAKPKAQPAKAAAAKPMATPAKPKAEPKVLAKPKADPKTKERTKAAPKAPEQEPVAASKPSPAPERTKEKPAKAPKAPKEKKTQKTTKPGKPAKPGKPDALTAEEKERLAKYKATLALLKADPEWPAFLAVQKELLLQMRDNLLPNMQNVTRDHLRSGASNVSSASGQHIGDAGSEAEVRDLTIRLLDKDREQLFEIDAALERIRMGNYGICEISLEPIPKKRLQVRPACRLTVKCQEEYEKKYGSYANYRAQNSDNVGFSGLQNAMESVISLDETEE